MTASAITTADQLTAALATLGYKGQVSNVQVYSSFADFDLNGKFFTCALTSRGIRKGSVKRDYSI